VAVDKVCLIAPFVISILADNSAILAPAISCVMLAEMNGAILAIQALGASRKDGQDWFATYVNAAATSC
jgi:hypothetical protein